MGGLFSCFGRVQLPTIYIDIDKAVPADDTEKSVVDACESKAISPSTELINQLSAYQDAQTLTSQAISNPTQENYDAAWAAVKPNVEFQVQVVDFSVEINRQLIAILDYALSLLNGNTLDVYVQHPSIVRSITQLFNIILKIDEVKLGLPKLLGDCSFFRRSVSRYPGHDELLERTANVTMFFARSAPFLESAIEEISKKYETNENVPLLFAALVDACTATLLNEQSQDESTKILLLRCMTGATLVFDHLNPQGAFHNKVKFAIVDAMQALTNFSPKQTNLINCIRYNSKHLSDQTTQPAIRQLFP